MPLEIIILEKSIAKFGEVSLQCEECKNFSAGASIGSHASEQVFRA